MNWEEACAAPSLLNLPYKIELNEWGTIMMSPVSLQHSNYATEIYDIFVEILEGGKALFEPGVETSKGTRVPDVAWFTREHWQENKGNFSASTAPMICVEVLSPSNAWGEMEEKKALFFAAGAEEVWVCGPDGKMRFFTTTGEVEKSEIAPEFPTEIILD